MRKMKTDINEGEKFNNLTFIKYTGKLNSSRSRYALFKCDCGRDHITLATSVKNNRIKSCGCIKIKYDQNMVNNNYLELVKKLNWKHGLYRCVCGTVKRIRNSSFRDGEIKSCGCKQRELASKINYIHGENNSITYTSWCKMKSRCLDQNCKEYRYYGGRGINICQRWIDSFENFLEDMGERPSKEYTIHRINNDGNYEIENCKWADKKEQSRDKSTTKWITYNNETKSLAEWVDIIGIKYSIVLGRLKYGWSVEKTFTTPLIPKQRFITYNNITHTLKEWSEILKIPIKTLNARLNLLGWSEEKTLSTPLQKKNKNNDL